MSKTPSTTSSERFAVTTKKCRRTRQQAVHFLAALPMARWTFPSQARMPDAVRSVSLCKTPQESLEQVENKGSKPETSLPFSNPWHATEPSLERPDTIPICHSSTNLIIFHTIHDFYRFYRFSLSIGFAQKSLRNPTSWLFYHYDFYFYSGAIWRNRDEQLCLLICISLWEIFLVAIFHHWFAFLQHPTFFSQGERSYRYIALHSFACFFSTVT